MKKINEMKSGMQPINSRLLNSLFEHSNVNFYSENISEFSGGKLGKLESAKMGVFQITGQGSTEEDSYGGNFDIYSKNKSARITVRLEYELE